MAGNTSAPVVQILWPAETADRYDIGTQVMHAHFWMLPILVSVCRTAEAAVAVKGSFPAPIYGRNLLHAGVQAGKLP